MARFISLEDAARKLGISPEQLRERAQHREVRAFQDGGSWRFREEDIEEISRSLGMGSDPDLSLSDLDLDVPADSDLDMSNFQLGVASPDPDRSSSQEVRAATDEKDVLLDDLTVPPELTGSSSTIIGMMPGGKQPSDSDVKLMPEAPTRGASDSDVRLSQPGMRRPSDSDVTLVSDDTGELPATGPVARKPAPAPKPVGNDPNETTLRPSPLLGSSGEVPAAGAPADSDSDFELTPSSVIDALQPDSGSDFELTALDNSEEIAVPKRSPSDSDVTGALGSASGVNLGRPTDSGINLLGGIDLGSADSIELAPLDDEEGTPAPGRSATAPPPKSATKAEKADPGATALPVRAEAEKDIFEDTDFEVEALGGEDRTMQLEATSDFDIDDAESGSEVFAVDEDEVDQNAATALGAAIVDDEFESSRETEAPSGDAWDVAEAEAEPAVAAKSAAPAPRAVSPLVAAGAGPEWGTPWVVLLGLTSLLMLIGAFVGFDLIANFNEFRADGPASGLVKMIAGLFGK